MTSTYKGNQACCKLGHKFVVSGRIDEEKGRDYETTEIKQLQSVDMNTIIICPNDSNKYSQRFM